MNKQEFYELCTKQTTITQQELDAKYNEFEAEMKTRGAPTEKLESLTLYRLRLFMAKELRSQAKKFKGVVVGASPVSDFGARKQYDEAKRLFGENPQETIDAKRTDHEGNPLYTKPKNRIGTRINPDEDVSRNVILLAQPDGETEWKRAVLVLRGSKQTAKPILFFTEVSFRANLSVKSPPEQYLLNGSEVTEFAAHPNGKEASYDQILTIFKNHFKEWITKISSLEPVWQQYAASNDFNKFVVLKSGVSRITMTGDNTRSNVFELMDPDAEVVDDKLPVVSCWVGKNDHEINFSDGAMDVVVFGRLGKGKDGQFMVETYGFKCRDEDVLKEKPKPVTEEVLQATPTKEEEW